MQWFRMVRRPMAKVFHRSSHRDPESIGHLRGSAPWRTGESRDQLAEDERERGVDRLIRQVGGFGGREQWPYVSHERGLSQLGEHAPFRFGAADPPAGPIEMEAETLDDAERGPATKPQFPAQERIVEQRDDRKGDDQVLFDLPRLRPGDRPAPGDDVERRDHFKNRPPGRGAQ